MAHGWFETPPRITFHDPLSAAAVFNPGICTFEQGRVNVNHEKGQTTFCWRAKGNDLVALKVDSARILLRSYFRVSGLLKSMQRRPGEDGV